MRQLLFVTFALLLLTSWAANAEMAGSAATMNTKTATAGSPIGLLYTSSGATVLSALKGLSNLAVINGSSVYELKVSVRSNTCNSTSADHFAVPVSGAITIERVAIGKVICLRSAGASSVVAGTVHTMAW